MPNNLNTFKTLFLLGTGLGMILACSGGPGLPLVQALFGYIEPPAAESVMDSMKREYDLCKRSDPNRNCTQIAYDAVRISQGLDPKPIPEGYVIITRDELESAPTPKKEESQKETQQ